MDFDTLFFFDPVVLSLSLVLEMHLNEIHGRMGLWDLIYPCTASGFPCAPADIQKLMISCCSFLLDLRQLWGFYCKAFPENIDNLVEIVAFLYRGFYQISINVLLNPRISSLPLSAGYSLFNCFKK